MSAHSSPRPARILVADLTLAGVTLIWGVTFPVVKGALAASSPLLFNAARMSCAAVLLALWYGSHLRRLSASTIAAGALLGLCLAGGYAFQTAGLNSTTPATSAFITGLSVVLVPVILALGWRKQVAPSAWLSVVLALAGLYLMVFTSASDPARDTLAAHRGDWLTLGCAACFALHIIIMSEFAPRHSFRQLATLQIGACALFTWIALPLAETPRWQSGFGLWVAVAATAVLATAVAFTAQTWAQQFTPASHTAVIFSLEPVFAWLTSTLFWHERLRSTQMAGAALILGAIIAVESPFARKLSR